MKTRKHETKQAAAPNDVPSDQDAINDMARELYLIKQANKAKSSALAKFEPSVDVDEQSFLAGTPFAFTIETPDGTHRICGKLRLRNTRNWDLADVVVKEAAR